VHVPGHRNIEQWAQGTGHGRRYIVDLCVGRLPRQSCGPQHDLLDRAVAVAGRMTKTAFHQSCEVSFHVKLSLVWIAPQAQGFAPILAPRVRRCVFKPELAHGGGLAIITLFKATERQSNRTASTRRVA
jgi:hypothetical protein